MDQDPLVSEQIDAGAKLAVEFDKYAPLRTAFWLKDREDGEWYLYLASDQINDSNIPLAYGAVVRIVGQAPHPWLDLFQVKVTGIDNRVTKAVVEIQETYPGSLGARLRNQILGGVNAAEFYIYPIPVPTPG
jgi:hypothetical protein